MRLYFVNMFIFQVFVVLTFNRDALTQTNVGEQCVDQYTYTLGRCAPGHQCDSAQQDWKLNGITPTFCSQSFEGPVVCCKDGSSILQTPPPIVLKNGERPISDTSDFNNNGQLDRRRVSERIGEQCVDQYTYTLGRCAPGHQCDSAQQDWKLNGITPTFCSQSFEEPVVCCKDGSSILQNPPPILLKNGERPISDTSDFNNNGQLDRRRVSERKCEEYSRSVVHTFSLLPLGPDPELVSISAPKCDYGKVALIIGGENAQLGEFPHMAAIGWVNFEENYSFNCGGSLISPRWVLTAGHCTWDPFAKDFNPAIVRLGDQNIDPSVQDGATPVEVPIKSIVKHPEYKPPLRYNDIALLQLATDVDFSSTVRPACLWRRHDFDTFQKAVATGWGVINVNTQETSKELQKVSISLLDNVHCDRLLANSRNRNWQGFAPTQICAGELRGGRDTCQGDSGAPLQVASRDNQCIFHILGVTSFGAQWQCARSGRPAIYTRVASYLDWIESVVWPNE